MGRELTMKALYQRDVGRGAPLATLDYLCAEEGVEGDEAAFARELLSGVLANLPELDRVIAGKAKEWRLDRLANVDRNILRLGVYELTHGGDVPASVAINEAVELAKVYGGPESGRFVNGVLGQVARELGAAVPEASLPDPDEAGSDEEAGVRLAASEALTPEALTPEALRPEEALTPEAPAVARPAAAEDAVSEVAGTRREGGEVAGTRRKGGERRARAGGRREEGRGRRTARDTEAPRGGPERGTGARPEGRAEGEPPPSAKRGS